MKEYEENFISNKEILERFAGKDVIVFGPGELGMTFWRLFFDKLSIKCFIISGVEQDELEPIHGIPVYNLRKLSELRTDEPIITASFKYYKLFAEQLLNEGYIFEKDFFIWHLYTQKLEEVNTFIEHNKKVWKDYLPKNPKNKILLLRYRFHGGNFIDMSYFVNYLARKHNAEIWSFGEKKDYSISSIDELYNAFNVNHHFLTDNFSDSQKQRAASLLEEIWPSLNTKEDWLNISVDGIDLGEDICSNYMRAWENGSFGEDGYENDDLKFENGIPVIDVHTDKLKEYLLKMLEEIFFWQDYCEKNKDVQAIILLTGMYDQSIIKKIAIKNNINVYIVAANWNSKSNYFVFGRNFKNYKKFFESLSDDEKKIGINWAKEKLSARLKGDSSDIAYMAGRSAFKENNLPPVLEKNDKIKIVICPHSLYDDPYSYGKFLFADHWDWLCYLGSLTLKTDYDWYLKIHPAAEKMDEDNLKRLVKYYPKIKLLPKDVSALQLKREGINFALTVWGTLGHEYPAMGIQVINAGNNPHIAFDFCYNPKTKEEYEYLLMNLDKLHKKIDMNEIYQFYCIHFLYLFNPLFSYKSVCYKNKDLMKKFETHEEGLSSKCYVDFLEEWSPERHVEILENVAERIEILDKYRDGEFIRNSQEFIDAKLAQVPAPPHSGAQ